MHNWRHQRADRANNCLLLQLLLSALLTSCCITNDRRYGRFVMEWCRDTHDRCRHHALLLQLLPMLLWLLLLLLLLIVLSGWLPFVTQDDTTKYHWLSTIVFESIDQLQQYQSMITFSMTPLNGTLISFTDHLFSLQFIYFRYRISLPCFRVCKFCAIHLGSLVH